jgi:Family of unknown function (DUF6390)
MIASPIVSPATTPNQPVNGPTLFARYAFGPNRFGYCGSDAVDELFAGATVAPDDRALRELATSFEGAWPYLELIARANDLPDPLDRRVVEAYWLGSSLLDRVSPRLMADSLAARFRPRLRPGAWHWLGDKAGSGGVPVHAFHVLDVFPRVGLLRSGSTDDALQVMDSCRIRWGRVLERDGESLVVNAVPLAMVDGKLVLGSPRAERVQAWRDGAAFVEGVGVGDIVAIHWSWACDRLTAERLDALAQWTNRQIAVANRTL